MAADLTRTVADVRPLNGCIIRRFTAGGTIAAGAPVYVASDGDIEQADGSAVGTVWAIGVAVADNDGSTSFSAGDPVDVVLYGPIAGYSSMTPGALGYVSDTAGAISDTAGTKDTIMGIALSATVFLVNPQLVDLS